jgi:broad specificity phosphatase PhoE
MKITTLLIIRHGQTDWNIAGKIQGHADVPLNETRQHQALKVASFLKEKNILLSALYSSDLQRAHQTAQSISQVFSLDIKTTPLLREQHGGLWQGKTKQQIAELHGAQDAIWEIVPGGETRADFLNRIVNHIALIAQNHPDESVAVVTHAGAIKNFLTHWKYDNNQWPSITNTAIVTVKYYHADEPHIELISIECP